MKPEFFEEKEDEGHDTYMKKTPRWIFLVICFQW
jgi:hypothetical protein